MMIIEEYRRLAGMSIETLYRKSGVPRYRLNRLESGSETLGGIPFYQVCALQDVLAIDWEELYNCQYNENRKRGFV